MIPIFFVLFCSALNLKSAHRMKTSMNKYLISVNCFRSCTSHFSALFWFICSVFSLKLAIELDGISNISFLFFCASFSTMLISLILSRSRCLSLSFSKVQIHPQIYPLQSEFDRPELILWLIIYFFALSPHSHYFGCLFHFQAIQHIYTIHTFKTHINKNLFLCIYFEICFWLQRHFSYFYLYA